MKRSLKARKIAFPALASAALTACLAGLLVAPALSSAVGIGINISIPGITLPGITDPSHIAYPPPLTQPDPSQPAAASTTPTPAADASSSAGGYGGYSNGYNSAFDLPLELGSGDAGLSTGEINSQGGIVPDWSATAQDESKATSAGVVEFAGLRLLKSPLSTGSAGSSAPPDSGMVGKVVDFSLPGLGKVRLGYFTTDSSAQSASNQMSLLIVNVDALNLNMQIPIGQSSDTSTRSGNKVESSASSALIGSASGQPLVLGQGLVNGQDALAVLVMDAESSSSADGATTAANSNSWTLAKLLAAGKPVLDVGSNGAKLGGTTIIPPTGNGKTLLALNQLSGFAGVFLGETWSQTDGKSYAFGGVNTLRLSLLDKDNALILGHAGTGVNATSATGPGAGPGQGNEGPPGSNIPPSQVSPPNDVPITPGDENTLGPPGDGDKPKPDTNPNPVPEPVIPDQPPAAAGPPAEDSIPILNFVSLPNTGADLFRLLLIAATTMILASYLIKPVTRPKKANKDEISQ